LGRGTRESRRWRGAELTAVLDWVMLAVEDLMAGPDVVSLEAGEADAGAGGAVVGHFGTRGPTLNEVLVLELMSGC
jgi:hypothetical protein